MKFECRFNINHDNVSNPIPNKCPCIFSLEFSNTKKPFNLNLINVLDYIKIRKKMCRQYTNFNKYSILLKMNMVVSSLKHRNTDRIFFNDI